MAQIRIVDDWRRSPAAGPSHYRSVMVIAEKWAEQRVLMRAYAESRDQLLPTIVLHGTELAIGPAGLDLNGPWGIHVGDNAEGRAHDIKHQLELSARRLAGAKGNPPRLADEAPTFEREPTGNWNPGAPRVMPRRPEPPQVEHVAAAAAMRVPQAPMASVVLQPQAPATAYPAGYGVSGPAQPYPAPQQASPGYAAQPPAGYAAAQATTAGHGGYPQPPNPSAQPPAPGYAAQPAGYPLSQGTSAGYANAGYAPMQPPSAPPALQSGGYGQPRSPSGPAHATPAGYHAQRHGGAPPQLPARPRSHTARHQAQVARTALGYTSGAGAQSAIVRLGLAPHVSARLGWLVDRVVPPDFHVDALERRVLNALGDAQLAARGIGQMIDVTDPVSFMEALTRKLEQYQLNLIEPGEPQGGEPTYRLRM